MGQHRAIVEGPKVIVSTLGRSVSRVREKYQTNKQIVVTIEMGALLGGISWELRPGGGITVRWVLRGDPKDELNLSRR